MENDLFIKYSKLLTWFSNTQLGRDYLGIPNFDERIGIFVPNGYHRILGQEDNGIVAQSFLYAHPVYAEKLYAVLLLIDLVHGYIHDFREAQEILLWGLGLRKATNIPALVRSIHFATSTFNPSAGGAGSGRLTSGNASFSTAVSGSGVTLITGIGQLRVSLIGGNYTVDRNFHPFDTSSLPDLAVITSAFVRYVGTAGGTQVDTVSLNVVQSTQSNMSLLATGDWNSIGSLTYGSIGMGAWNASGNNDITLNSNGRGNINLTGFSGFACRTDKDQNGVAPTGIDDVGISSIGTIVLSATYLIAYAQTFSDTITPTDTLQRSATRKLSDTQTLSETFLASKLFLQSFSDTITLSEYFKKLLNGVSTVWTKTAKVVGSWSKVRKT